MGLAPDWQTAGTSTTVGNRGSFGHAGQPASTPVPRTSVARLARLRDSHPSERDIRATVQRRTSTPADAGSGGSATDGVVINLAAFADDPDTTERDDVGTTSTASIHTVEPLTWDVLAAPGFLSKPTEKGLQVPQFRSEDPMRMAQSQAAGESGTTQCIPAAFAHLVNLQHQRCHHIIHCNHPPC